MNNDSLTVSDKAAEESVEIEDISLNYSTQARVATCSSTVTDYAAKLEGWAAGEGDGWLFPPVVLFREGEKGAGQAGVYYVGDGFHRIMAAVQCGRKSVPAVVHPGGRVAALKFALGANEGHGLPRGWKDVRRAVELGAAEFPDLTNGALAKLVKCDVRTVGKYRTEEQQAGPKVGADGKVYGEERVDRARVASLAAADGASTRAGSAGAGGASDDEEAEFDTEEDAAMVPMKPAVGGELAQVLVAGGDRPSRGELQPWVGVVPFWSELAEGSDLRPREGAAGRYVRAEIVAWCQSPTAEAVEALRVACTTGEGGGAKLDDKAFQAGLRNLPPRWDGFRVQVVSLEHAERERQKWLAAERERALRIYLGRVVARSADSAVLADAVLRELERVVPREALALFRAVWEPGEALRLEDVYVILRGWDWLSEGVDSARQDLESLGVRE